jgi:hypothetical protein
VLPVEADEAGEHGNHLLVANAVKVAIRKEGAKTSTAMKKTSPSHFLD